MIRGSGSGGVVVVGIGGIWCLPALDLGVSHLGFAHPPLLRVLTLVTLVSHS